MAAWLLKRFARGSWSLPAGAIKVIGGVAVGQRERVVVVEVGGTWLVVGVAPGQVRALAHHAATGTSADDSLAIGCRPRHRRKGFQVGCGK